MDEKGQKIVFVRHAHRDKPHPDKDNGLSEKGRGQAANLVKAFKAGKLPEARLFWSSPKLRCRETLAPLAEVAGADMKIEPLLDEQTQQESSTKFIQRIESLVQKITALNQTVYLCSHGDLIPEAIDQLAGRVVDASKGEAIVLVSKKGRWELQ